MDDCCNQIDKIQSLPTVQLPSITYIITSHIQHHISAYFQRDSTIFAHRSIVTAAQADQAALKHTFSRFPPCIITFSAFNHIARPFWNGTTTKLIQTELVCRYAVRGRWTSWRLLWQIESEVRDLFSFNFIWKGIASYLRSFCIVQSIGRVD